MDSIDIHMQVPRVEFAKLRDMHPGESSLFSPVSRPSEKRSAIRQLQVTARVYHCVLKLSRTITDLVESETITPVHLAEALQYRPKLDLMS